MNGNGTRTELVTAWRSMSLSGRVVTGLVLLAGVLLAIAGFQLVRAVIGPSVPAFADEKARTRTPAELAAAFDKYVKEIDGRSLFFVPAAPRTDAPPPPTDDKPPPPPSHYGGPAIVAMVNDTVWFKDGRRLVAGAAADGDLMVVRVEGPWEAVIKWKDVEFTVPLFTRDKLVLKEEKKPAVEEKPKDEAPKPETTETEKAEQGPEQTTSGSNEPPRVNGG